MAESRGQRWSWWMMALMLALAIGAIWAWQRLFDEYGAADEVDAALVYPAGDGAQVVILDRVSHSARARTNHTSRLNLWAPGEAAPRRREMIPDSRLLAAGPRSLWLHASAHGVHARDPATFELRVDEARLGHKNPELAVGLMPPNAFEAWKVNSGVDPSGRFIVTARDGRRFAIDPESFTATAYTGEALKTIFNFEGACVGAAAAPEPIELELRGEGPRKQVRRGEREVGEFVTPERLAACSVEATPSPGVALLLHRATLDEPSPSQLTAVSADGEPLWTTKLTGESDWGWVRVLFASMTTNEVLLVVQGEYGRFSRLKYGLMTLDRKTGQLRSAPAV